MITLHLETPAQTEAVGRAIGDELRAGDLVLLRGDLGAGKTTLARAMIRGFAQDDDLDVPSPTFALVEQYQFSCPLSHVDLYRLDDPGEARELGLDDLPGAGIAIVEWPDRVPALAGQPHLDAAMSGGAVAGRVLTLKPRGRTWAGRLDTLAQQGRLS